MKRKFYYWLEKKEAFTQFNNNFESPRFSLSSTIPLDVYMDRQDTENYLLGAFDWMSTSEGRDFWSNLHYQWSQVDKDSIMVPPKLSHNTIII